jgi:hypothetical protein
MQLSDTIDWIKADYQSNKIRFIFEVIAWVLSLTATILVAVTAPLPPMHILYPMFIAQCVIFAWSSYTRNSLGLFANYSLITLIDTIGLIKITFFI